MTAETTRPASIAETPEILAFYTSVMRGEEEDASISNRISAADKLLGQHQAESSVNRAMDKLDTLLDEFRSAVENHSVIGSEVAPEDQIDPDTLDTLPDDSADRRSCEDEEYEEYEEDPEDDDASDD